ncbi:DUF6106 family protein [Butyrivibrio sp. LC3010]|uniref:DUF6106 family protein n=1 Tax=Butyrivibrio sp. LC3010 TaxID=1280680 RepID=UPI00041EF7F0|nr:DUF6106 family protein [Butyrivibrio sp. LC3010]
MMNDNSYVELLIARKPQPLMVFLKYLTILMAVFSFLLGFLSGNILFMILFVAFAVGAYFISLNASIEFEYQYCEREITVDKILNKSKRKRVATFETERMEVIAPSRSYHLDEYRNKDNYRKLDFSSGEVQQPDVTYTMYYDGREKVILEPNKELIDALKNVAPRKVFTD